MLIFRVEVEAEGDPESGFVVLRVCLMCVEVSWCTKVGAVLNPLLKSRIFIH